MGRKPVGHERELLYVLYDGTCNLCLASVRRLKELRSSAELKFIPLQSLDESPLRVPGIEGIARERLLSKIHVFERSGAYYAGADGIVRILRTVGGFKWLAPLYRLPGMRRVADKAYRFIAARRYEWFGRADESCENGACAIPGRDHLKGE